MKLLCILTYYSPHWTGLTQHAKAVAEGLAGHGYDITVLTTRHDASLALRETVRGVRIKRTPVWFRFSRTFVSPALFFRSIMEIKNTHRVVVYLPFAELLWVATWATVFGKELTLVHNGDLVLPKGLVNRIIEKVYYGSTYLAMIMAHHVIVYTMDYAKHSPLLSKFLHKSHAILPPIARLTSNPKKYNALRQRVFSHRYIVGFAGRFVEEKGFDILLAAIPMVRKILPDTVFVFAGETHVPYESFFESYGPLIQKNRDALVFLGLLPRPDMANFYRLLNVFVLPSRTECLAFVQAEAMMAGVPVVVTNVPGARIPVLKTGMGMIVSKENARALAEGILDVLKSKNRYKKFRARAIALFDEQQSINQFEKLLCQ